MLRSGGFLAFAQPGAVVGGRRPTAPLRLLVMSVVESNRSYGGLPVAQRRAQRRARFAEAALSVFAERTYAKSSVTDICAVAGLSRRQFYEEYASREELLVAVYDDIQQDARAAVRTAVASVGSADLSAIIVAAVTAYVSAMATDTRRAKLAFVEIVGVGAEVEAHRLLVRREWGQVLAELAGAAMVAELPSGGLRMVTTAFIGAVNATVHQWSLDDPRPPIADLVDVLTTMLLALMARIADVAR
ncbi:TetR/AcrR family transcriptional regulator [Nocardia sp. CWNU-33]|uniref:TetR/AcrR family transcriptional regulator n=1 Tax=Nocardia sp. CWNU-33 TaxID=3392117 RepID=UPI00398ED532